MIRRLAISAIACAGIAAAVYVVHLSRTQQQHFIERRGHLTSQRIVGTDLRQDSARIIEVEVGADSGLVVELRVLVPPEAETRKVPLLLMLGGHRTGKRAIDLVDESNGVAYASIDYPYAGNHSIKGLRQSIAAVPGIQAAFLDTPPALMLAMDWLSRQSWFDPAHAELVGISLGVPFAAVAGALDDRFSRVWLIHGGADNYNWVMHAARGKVENQWLRSIAVRSALLLAHGNSFRTDEWLEQIAPRPAMIVSAKDDDRVPRSAQQGFIDAQRYDHVTLIWTSGKHIGPNREAELRELFSLVTDEVI